MELALSVIFPISPVVSVVLRIALLFSREMESAVIFMIPACPVLSLIVLVPIVLTSLSTSESALIVIIPASPLLLF